jgi:hypothetical protein
MQARSLTTRQVTALAIGFGKPVGQRDGQGSPAHAQTTGSLTADFTDERRSTKRPGNLRHHWDVDGGSSQAWKRISGGGVPGCVGNRRDTNVPCSSISAPHAWFIDASSGQKTICAHLRHLRLTLRPEARHEKAVTHNWEFNRRFHR